MASEAAPNWRHTPKSVPPLATHPAVHPVCRHQHVKGHRLGWALAAPDAGAAALHRGGAGDAFCFPGSASRNFQPSAKEKGARRQRMRQAPGWRPFHAPLTCRSSPSKAALKVQAMSSPIPSTCGGAGGHLWLRNSGGHAGPDRPGWKLCLVAGMPAALRSPKFEPAHGPASAAACHFPMPALSNHWQCSGLQPTPA